MKEGKKGTNDLYKDKQINKNKDKCDECNGDLIKLHTTLGKVKIRNRNSYKDMYWVCVCDNCGRYVRVLDKEVKIGNYIVGTSTKNKLRER